MWLNLGPRCYEINKTWYLSEIVTFHSAWHESREYTINIIHIWSFILYLNFSWFCISMCICMWYECVYRSCLHVWVLMHACAFEYKGHQCHLMTLVWIPVPTWWLTSICISSSNKINIFFWHQACMYCAYIYVGKDVHTCNKIKWIISFLKENKKTNYDFGWDYGLAELEAERPMRKLWRDRENQCILQRMTVIWMDRLIACWNIIPVW